MDLLSLLLAAVLTAGAATDAGGPDETRATIIDTGQPAASETIPPPSDEARANIIDIG